ncbi:YhcN/YlaJ family sporulation lipoprotein [Fictibacillus enclensis]|uniref:YhcN/YlaJ family sporulation lipoprotein n=1 Tax=Fictibacillus enclensis TaxID=1017270 RepID=UPI0025A04612|nr:YhcN/YlaJ family sporulation lipoprotein [Fictibacillus enclensis]MDM5339243.1 YhcN/YlaJ family sporulation lipoprotein [Fictibacillus enclensis]
MKPILSGLTVLTLAAGLVGCNTNKGALDRNDNDVRPIGYYNKQSDRDGMDRSKGPVTDMMDNNRTDNNAPRNVGYDQNYDGALAEKIRDRVNRMNNVDDAHVILNDNNVIVGIDTSENNKKAVDHRVYREVKKLVPNRDVRVTTDDNLVNRIKNVDNNLQNGKTTREVSSDVKGIMSDIGKAGTDLGNAVKRPFENNR